MSATAPRQKKKSPSPSKPLSLNQRLQRLSRKWIKKLKLQNFQKIDIRLYSKEQMDGSLGLAHWSPEYGQAQVLILDPMENEDVTADEFEEFMEVTLVHELLHIRLDGHKTMESVTANYDPAYEAAINILSDLLVKD